jgi:hypothetical protein
MHLRQFVTVALVIATTMLVPAGQALAQKLQEEMMEKCSNPEGWEPLEELSHLLAAHQMWIKEWEANNRSEAWAQKFPQGNANLCGANLIRANLAGASLTGANLTKAWLIDANLTEAQMHRTKLTEALLDGANLTRAWLTGVNLTRAWLTGVNLTEAWLRGANLTETQLDGADMTKAWLTGANLTEAWLTGTNLTEAWLTGANLTETRLDQANLTEARLDRANLTGAWLNRANLTATRLAESNLTDSIYAPISPAPNPYVADIQGLQTVYFPKGRETGLVQLRELLQKAGLRDLERQATYAIERGRTRHAILDGSLLEVLEGLFRFIAYDLTTGYGLHPRGIA